MSSGEIQSFAKNIDSAISGAINVVKEDYKKRFEAIENIIKMPDAVMQLGGTSRDTLIRGAEGEMQRVQKEQCRVIEEQFGKVDDKLSSMKGNVASAADIKYLTDRLSAWSSRVTEISIPSGPHSKPYPFTATPSMSKIVDKWKKYCDTDPTIQKAEIYERKEKVELEINNLVEKNDELEKRIPTLKDEYNDRISNAEKYKTQIRNEVDSEVDSISTDIRHAEEDVEDLESNKKSISMQLDSTGIFAFGKKKELKAQIEKIEDEIKTAKERVHSISQKKQEIENSVVDRIAALTDKINQLYEDIESSEKELEANGSKINQLRNELEELESKLQ